MKFLDSILPRNFLLFLLPDSLLLYRYGSALKQAWSLKEKKSYPLERIEDLDDVLDRVRREFRPVTDDSWFLGLPLKFFTAVNFTLPAAASKNMEQAVHYGLMRHIPYDLSTVYTNYTATQAQGEVEIAALTAPKEQVRPYLEAVSRAGIVLSVLFPSLAMPALLNERDGVYVSGGKTETEILVWKNGEIVFQSWDSGEGPEDKDAGGRFLERAQNLLANVPTGPGRAFFFWEPRLPVEDALEKLGAETGRILEIEDAPGNAAKIGERFPYQINLVPPSVVKGRKIAFWVQAGAALFLCLMLTAYPLAKLLGKHSVLSDLNKKIEQLEQETGQLTNIREKNQKTAAQLRKVGEFINSYPSVSEALKELTEILPRDVYLESFIFSGEKVMLKGQAKSAATVLETVENSPLFKEARFDSQITKGRSLETFRLIAELE